jgi:hypothetical protein
MDWRETISSAEDLSSRLAHTKYPLVYYSCRRQDSFAQHVHSLSTSDDSKIQIEGEENYHQHNTARSSLPKSGHFRWSGDKAVGPMS